MMKCKWIVALMVLIMVLPMDGAMAQAPGTTPVTVSNQMQMLHGRKYYVHIVEKGQTVYSIARAYKVESYDAVTHHDIHFLHAGDTVWLPARGQFSEADSRMAEAEHEDDKKAAVQSPSPTNNETIKSRNNQPLRLQEPQAPTIRKTGKVLKVALMMPLHINQIDEISTSKFDIEQRGKRNYKQFEFIEFYEGMIMALEKLDAEGCDVELNVVDVPDNNVKTVEETFKSYNVAQCDVLVALLFRDSFSRAAELAKEAGIYIVNPMAVRSEICKENPYVVKVQPSVKGEIAIMLKNMKKERPDAHLYIIHSGAKSEKAVLDELKHQLTERGDIKYTIFNWNQNGKLVATLKATPDCNVVSIYDKSKNENHVFSSQLLNRLSAIKVNSPTLYTIVDWTTEFNDVDFQQLQLLGYHTFSTAWDMTNEVHVQFLKDFRSTYGTEPTSTLAATAYDLTMYIVGGLYRQGVEFWKAPTDSSLTLTQPIQLLRLGTGLENDRANLYKMENLRLVPADVK